MHIPVISNYK